MKQISTFFAENGMGRAEVWDRNGTIAIDYLDANGVKYHTETTNGTVQEALARAQEWSSQTLKG